MKVRVPQILTILFSSLFDIILHLGIGGEFVDTMKQVRARFVYSDAGSRGRGRSTVPSFKDVLRYNQMQPKQ